jgi:hypothetical protein
MKQNESKSLTEDELVRELEGEGCVGIKKRELANWRKLHFLPKFDMTGRGRGQGVGRAPNAWTQRDQVINRALWTYDLRQMYGRYEDLYLPLFQLGYSVPIDIMRKLLIEPLVSTVESIETERRSREDVGIEDVLEDGLIDAAIKNSPRETGPFQPPLETLLVAVNLLLNSDYDLTGLSFEDGVSTFREWNSERRKKCAEDHESDDVFGFSNIFEFAQFIIQHLSVPKIKEAIESATADDFMAVRRDIEVLREIGLTCGWILSPMLEDVPDEMMESFEDMLPALFTIGGWCIRADFSLRKDGYGTAVEYWLSEALNKVRASLNDENLMKKLYEIRPRAADIQNIVERMKTMMTSNHQDIVGLGENEEIRTIEPATMMFHFHLNSGDCHQKLTGNCSLEPKASKGSQQTDGACSLDYCPTMFDWMKGRNSQDRALIDFFNRSSPIKLIQHRCGHYDIKDGQHQICIAKKKGLTVLARIKRIDEDCGWCAGILHGDGDELR